MSISDKTKQELHEILTYVISQGYNLTIHQEDREPIKHSVDVDALVEATVRDSFQVFEVFQARTLRGTFVCDLEMADQGERLVASHTRSIDHLFR